MQRILTILGWLMLVSVIFSQGVLANIDELSGENLKWDQDNQLLIVENGEVYLCDGTYPIRVKARQITVHQGEMAVLEGVTYYEGPVPVFYWPLLLLPLDETATLDAIGLPEAGYSSDAGLYLKTTFPYVISKDSLGRVYADYSSRNGRGVGVSHLYRLGQSYGELYGYTLQGKRYDFRLSQRGKVAGFDWDIDLSGEVVPGHFGYQQWSMFGVLSYDALGKYTLTWDQELFLEEQIDYLPSSEDELIVEVLPELTWVSEDNRFQLGIGRYREGANAPINSRAMASYDFQQQVELGLQTSLEYSASLAGHYYFPGYQGGLTNMLGVNHRFSEWFEARLEYHRSDRLGETPFSFDQIFQDNYLGGEVTVGGKKAGILLSSGYDFQLGELIEIDSHLWSENERGWRLDIYGGYSFLEGLFKEQSVVVEYNPGGHANLMLAGYYQPEMAAWQQIDASVELQVDPSWNLQYQISYDPLGDFLLQNELQLAKTIDCRVISLSYDSVGEQFWLEYRVNELF